MREVLCREAGSAEVPTCRHRLWRKSHNRETNLGEVDCAKSQVETDFFSKFYESQLPTLSHKTRQGWGNLERNFSESMGQPLREFLRAESPLCRFTDLSIIR